MERADSSLAESDSLRDADTSRAGRFAVALSMVFAAIAAAGSVVVKTELDQRGSGRLERRLDHAFLRTRDAVAERLATHERIVARMAERIPELQLPTAEAWHLESSRLLRDVDSLEVVLWVDPEGKPLRAVPSTAAAVLVGGGDDSVLRAWIRSEHGALRVSSLPSGAQGIWFTEPYRLSPAAPPSGYVVAGFDASRLLSGTLDRGASDCRATLSRRDVVVCRSAGEPLTARDRYARAGEVGEAGLTLLVVPTAAFLASSEGDAAWVVLGAGLTLAGAIVLAGFLLGRHASLRRVVSSARTEVAYEHRERERLEARVRALAAVAELRDAGDEDTKRTEIVAGKDWDDDPLEAPLEAPLDVPLALPPSETEVPAR